MSSDPAPAADRSVEIRYRMDVERLGVALKLPAHAWLSSGRDLGALGLYIGLSLWAVAFGVRALVGPAPWLIEGFAVGVGMYVWDQVRFHVRLRLGAPGIVRSLGVDPSKPVVLTVDGDSVRVRGVAVLQRFPHRSVTHWTDGGGWLLLYVGPYVLPVDVGSLPPDDAATLREWLRREPRGEVELPARGERDLEYVRSRAVYVLAQLEASHAQRWNLAVFAVSLGVAVLFAQMALLAAVVVGWNLALVVGQWRASGTVTEPRVLSLDPRGVVQRGADGWFTEPWNLVVGARRFPGIGWVLRTRHGIHPIGRDVQGDVEGFLERVARRETS